MRKLFDVVPGWLYAVALTCALGVAGALWLDLEHAKAAEATAKTDLAKVMAESATAAANLATEHREKERRLFATTQKVTDELQTRLADRDSRVAALERRLRAQPSAASGAGGEHGGEAAGAASGGDGAGVSGFRGVDGADLVVIDGQAQHELATLAVTANEARDTLTACRKLLREQWRATGQ